MANQLMRASNIQTHYMPYWTNTRTGLTPRRRKRPLLDDWHCWGDLIYLQAALVGGSTSRAAYLNITPFWQIGAARCLKRWHGWVLGP